MKPTAVCIYYFIALDGFIVGSTFVRVYAVEADDGVEV
jgi:hypothetical protein